MYIEDSEDKYEKLEQTHETLKTDFEQVKDENEQLKLDCQGKELDIKELSAQIRRLNDNEKKMNSNHFKLNNDYKDAQEEIKTLSQKHDKQVVQIKHLQIENNDLEARAEKAESKNKVLKSRLTTRNTMHSQLSRNLKIANNQSKHLANQRNRSVDILLDVKKEDLDKKDEEESLYDQAVLLKDTNEKLAKELKSQKTSKKSNYFNHIFIKI